MSHDTSIQVVYAATEAPMMQWFVGEVVAESEERVPIGYPLVGNELAVVDEDGELTPEGEVASCSFRALMLPSGFGRKDGVRRLATRATKAMRTCEYSEPGTWFGGALMGSMTGFGRKDRQVKIRGARVELDGVETAIRRHPSVRDVGVTVRIDSETGLARLVAYVQPDEVASDQFIHELGLMMRRVAPAHMRPWRYYLASVIPRLRNSKLDTRGLLALDVEKSRAEADARPADADTSWIGTDPIDIAVARVWRDTLGLQLTCPEDDFFDLGGDSLRAITMTFELEKALRRDLPTNLISQVPTFRSLLRKTQGECTGCLLPARRPQAGTGDTAILHPRRRRLRDGVVQYLPEDELAWRRDRHSGARPGWMRTFHTALLRRWQTSTSRP